MDADTSRKAKQELAFWESRVRQQGVLTNDHFEFFFTTHFDLTRDFYRNKKLLDIGCGPRGSLEWAVGASLRIGLDPLAEAYQRLGAGAHSMCYVVGGAERIPFPNGCFDVVSSFNSLDHVDDLDRAISEICRVVGPQGRFLLIADIHRRPTVLEPAAFSWNVLEPFLPHFEVEGEGHFEVSVVTAEGYGDIYQSLRKGIPYDHTDLTDRYGILSVKLRKRPAV
jgi:SAM-dependent methyltransferase